MSRFHVDPSERVEIAEFDPTEVISDTPPNVITIRARMSVEIAGRVSSELAKLGEDNKIEMHIGSHIGALFLHNIVAWRGPDFDGLPCTPANIRSLPTGDPFIERVANTISERNKPRESPKKGLSTGATSASGIAPDSIASQAFERLATNQPSGLLMSRLHSRVDSDGDPST